MATLKLSAFDTAAELNSFDYFVGVRDNEDGTFSNYKFTYAQVAALAAAGAQVRITITEDSRSVTNAFFESNEISTIFANNQVYISDVDFTQDGDTITGVTIGFYIDQIIIARV